MRYLFGKSMLLAKHKKALFAVRIKKYVNTISVYKLDILPALFCCFLKRKTYIEGPIRSKHDNTKNYYNS